MRGRKPLEGTQVAIQEKDGHVVIETKGRSAHAGVNLEGGRNALVSLANVLGDDIPRDTRGDLLRFAGQAGQDLRQEDPVRVMNIHVGTSGYSYKEWKGSFYPEDMKPPDMLRFYASRFDTVEINNTFYRMPTAEVLARWGEQTADGFQFVLKAPQRSSE